MTVYRDQYNNAYVIDDEPKQESSNRISKLKPIQQIPTESGVHRDELNNVYIIDDYPKHEDPNRISKVKPIQEVKSMNHKVDYGTVNKPATKTQQETSLPVREQNLQKRRNYGNVDLDGLLKSFEDLGTGNIQQETKKKKSTTREKLWFEF